MLRTITGRSRCTDSASTSVEAAPKVVTKTPAFSAKRTMFEIGPVPTPQARRHASAARSMASASVASGIVGSATDGKRTRLSSWPISRMNSSARATTACRVDAFAATNRRKWTSSSTTLGRGVSGRKNDVSTISTRAICSVSSWVGAA